MNRIQTQWSVFTGSPCSGKTSVLELLRDRGFPVRRELARAYFDQELGKGRTLQDICADQQALQRMFLEKGLEGDRGLNPDLPYMLDRGPVDAIAHYMLYGFPYEEALQQASEFRYRFVFYFAKLPYRQDAVRVEDAVLAAQLDECFKRAYTEMGYELIEVPLMRIEERAEFIAGYLAA